MCTKNVLTGVLVVMLLLGSTVVQADTNLLPGGDISSAGGWDNGLPSPDNPGTIAVDGISTVTTFGWDGSVINHTSGDIVCTATNGFNMFRGGTWNMSGGSITARYILSNSDQGDCLFNFSGGTAILADVEGTQHMGVANSGMMTISGSFIADGTHATVDVQATSGTIDIASDWTGYWTWAPYSGTDWKTIVTAGDADNGFRLDGEIIDAATFDARFLVTDDGKTLSMINDPVAIDPSPPDMATDVLRDVVLSWEPGELANTHNVYLGTVFDDVNDAVLADAVSPGQTAATYDPGRLDFGQTYYWRIDEVNAPPDSTIFKGFVWSFTTELLAYQIENVIATASSSNVGGGAENTVNDSGVDANDLHSTETTDMWLSSPDGDGPAWIEYEFERVSKLHEMWVWNHNSSLEQIYGFGFKDVSVEYSADGIDYKALGTTHEFAQAPGTPGYAHDTIDFEGAAAKYVRLTANSTWGSPLGGLSEVRFFRIPVHAKEPYPDSGATDVDLDVALGWKAGREAVSHDVYIGTDPDALTLAGPVTEPAFDAASLGLELGQTYYWRVDEVNDAELPDTWQGDPWSFTTSAFLVIENFDDYNTSDNQIWWSWKDGLAYVEHDGQPAYAGNRTGSAVGDETTATFMEMNIFQGGTQSMPVWYDNNKQDFAKYSETALALPAGKRDWTTGSPVELSLWFRGEATNTAERLYVAVADTAVVYHEDLNAAQLARWTEWVIPLETLADQGVSLTNVDNIAIGLGTRGNMTNPGGAGKMYFDEIRLYPDRSAIVPITVPDAGFDDHVLTNVGDYIDIADSSYTGAWKSHSGNAWIDYGYYAGDVDLPARSGNNKAYGYNDYIYQILDETFVEGEEYTLSVWVGQAWSGYADGWWLYFTGEDYTNNLIEASGNGPVGSWGQASLVYTATAADAGKKIGIKMYGDEYVTFEDVTLFHSAPADILQPALADNLTVNPSFESPDLGPGGTGQWADYVDNWIINGCYLEDGSWFVAPDGVASLKMWSGAAIWQQIGNVSPNTDYEISLFIGRADDTSAVQVELWAGGDPSALPTSHGIIGDTVGATLIGGTSLTPTIEVGQSELMGLSLNTGADFGSEDALWIRIESISADGTATYVDNVMVAIP